eukprot:1428678-Rhodomonas_salina.1
MAGARCPRTRWWACTPPPPTSSPTARLLPRPRPPRPRPPSVRFDPRFFSFLFPFLSFVSLRRICMRWSSLRRNACCGCSL